MISLVAMHLKRIQRGHRPRKGGSNGFVGISHCARSNETCLKSARCRGFDRFCARTSNSIDHIEQYLNVTFMQFLLLNVTKRLSGTIYPL